MGMQAALRARASAAAGAAEHEEVERDLLRMEAAIDSQHRAFLRGLEDEGGSGQAGATVRGLRRSNAVVLQDASEEVHPPSPRFPT